MKGMAIKAMLDAACARSISDHGKRGGAYAHVHGSVRRECVVGGCWTTPARCSLASSQRINKIAWIFPGDPAEVTGASQEDGLEDSLFPAARRLKAGASWISPDERFVCRTKTPGKPRMKLGCTRFDSSHDIDGGFLAMRRSIKTF